MTKYEIHQINLTEAEIDMVNDGHIIHKYELKRDMFGRNVPDLAVQGLAKNFYTHVANITADGLNTVFHFGNVGPEQMIERLDQMASVSVGDIIVNTETNTKHVVTTIGFKEI